LREDVQSLAGYLQRGVRAPNAGELERMKDLTAEVEKAVAKVNGLITKDIAAINEALKAEPRIAVEPIR
jgi:glycine cleavage system H lipoate-binding protein